MITTTMGVQQFWKDITSILHCTIQVKSKT
jgi:hypothetical protein